MLRRPPGLTVLILVLALVAAGCATAVPAPTEPVAGPTPTPSRTPSASGGGRLIGRGTVIDEGKGPWLCIAVRDSLPPQCGGGVELASWRWPERGTERLRKTTWGDFAVVGTYDGKRFRAEKTVEPAFPPEPVDEARISTPCPEPSDGWRAPDPARATFETQEQAMRLAARRPGYGDAWVEELSTPGDPATTVLNFSFTRDLAGTERAIRQVWGGLLCISEAERTHAELAKIQREVFDTPRFLSSSFGFGRVDLMVVYDDGALQRRLDEKYGTAVVRVGSALQPYSE